MQSVVCTRHILQDRYKILNSLSVILTYGKRDGNDDVKCRPVFCRAIFNASGTQAWFLAAVTRCNSPSSTLLKSTLLGLRLQCAREWLRGKKLKTTSISEYTVPWPSISTPQATSSLSQIQWSTRLPNHDMFYIHTVLMPFQMPMDSKTANAPKKYP